MSDRPSEDDEGDDFADLREGPIPTTRLPIASEPVIGHTESAEGKAPDASQPRFRAGRDLQAAVLVAVVLLAAIGVSLFAYRPSFAYIAGVAVVYGCWELSAAVATAGIRASFLPIAVGGVCELIAAWNRGPDGLTIAFFVTACGVLVWRLADGAQHYLRDVGLSLFLLLYLPTLAGFAVLIVRPQDGAARIIAFIVTVVCSDTGGYFTGVLFGRHPLAPIVSKGKTWEGAAGSVVWCSAAGILFLTLTFHEAWWQGLVFGVAIAVTAMLGDLGESLIKRDIGVKDMGKLLPGHGGLMDRLDSLLPCAAVAYLLLAAFHPA